MPDSNDREILRRIVRSTRLDRAVYRDIAADGDANRDAMSVVIAASLAVGLAVNAVFNLPVFGIWGTLIVLVLAAELIGWAIAFPAAYTIVRFVSRSNSTPPVPSCIFRVLAFATAPHLLLVGALIFPAAFSLLSLVALMWTIAGAIVAIRSVLQCSLMQAATTGIAFVLVQGLGSGMVIRAAF